MLLGAPSVLEGGFSTLAALCEVLECRPADLLGGGRDRRPDNALMENISIRPARSGELAAVAALRWDWLVENGGEALGERAEFLRHFVE